ncbi:MAG: hypothetical protein QN157_03585 [Armatimonadota bacterium]|nr:hypothetical protein [Armatimonadota bacterium]
MAGAAGLVAAVAALVLLVTRPPTVPAPAPAAHPSGAAPSATLVLYQPPT